MKILIAPNAFKESLSAPDVAAAIVRGLERSGLDCEIEVLPIADGGDDTLKVLTMQGGTTHTLTVEDPLGRPLRRRPSDAPL